MSQSASSLPDGDAEIVRLLTERQSIGLRSLLDRYGAITQSAIKKALGNSLDDAEIDEAMSTASYNAWRAIDTYEPDKGSLRAWFFVIARNQQPRYGRRASAQRQAAHVLECSANLHQSTAAPAAQRDRSRPQDGRHRRRRPAGTRIEHKQELDLRFAQHRAQDAFTNAD